MDFRQYQSIILNGKIFTENNIDELIEYDNGSLKEFLKQWMNNDAEITVHTSGSTGSPKPILVTKNAMLKE